MKTAALLRMHFIVFLWGFTAILGKLISTDATSLVFYRMFCAALMLFIFIKYFKKSSLRIEKKLLFRLVVIGVFMALHWLLFFHSIKISNVSIALSCLSLSTLFAAIIEPIIFKRKVDWAEVFIGLIIVICIGLIFNAEFEYKWGIFYGVLCALFGTIFSVLNGRVYGQTSSENIIFYEIFSGWCILALYLLITGEIGESFTIDRHDFGLIVLLASVFTAYPMLESVKLMKFVSPFTLILTVNLEPVYGIILAFFIFGESEHMSPIFYAASIVMILAIVINGIIKSKKNTLN